MKIFIVASILFITSGFQLLRRAELSSALSVTFFQYDTSAKKTKEFKLFSKQFFDAIERKDVPYLKAHIIFPIVNSSLTAMDTTLGENDKIDGKYFFKNLDRLFPKNISKKIEKGGGFYASRSQPKFFVRIYNFAENDANEANFTWFFVKKNGRFYFTQFIAEL